MVFRVKETKRRREFVFKTYLNFVANLILFEILRRDHQEVMAERGIVIKLTVNIIENSKLVRP